MTSMILTVPMLIIATALVSGWLVQHVGDKRTRRHRAARLELAQSVTARRRS